MKGYSKYTYESNVNKRDNDIFGQSERNKSKLFQIEQKDNPVSVIIKNKCVTPYSYNKNERLNSRNSVSRGGVSIRKEIERSPQIRRQKSVYIRAKTPLRSENNFFSKSNNKSIDWSSKKNNKVNDKDNEYITNINLTSSHMNFYTSPIKQNYKTIDESNLICNNCVNEELIQMKNRKQKNNDYFNDDVFRFNVLLFFYLNFRIL
jgi:hypothetical protein